MIAEPMPVARGAHVIAEQDNLRRAKVEREVDGGIARVISGMQNTPQHRKARFIFTANPWNAKLSPRSFVYRQQLALKLRANPVNVDAPPVIVSGVAVVSPRSQ